MDLRAAVSGLALVAFCVSGSPANAGAPVNQPAITLFESSSTGGDVAAALDSLGYLYVNRGASTAAFDVDLASGSYDVALVNSSNVDITVLADSLATFLDNGGRLMMFLYNLDNVSGHALWAQMGAAYAEDLPDPPASIEILEAGHTIFNVPNSVAALGVSNTVSFDDNGDHLSLLSRGVALARTAGGDASDLLIVARRDGRSILNTFLPGNYIGDPDMAALIENEIVFVVEGIVRDDFEAYPTPFDLVFSPTRCTGCSSDVDYDPSEGSCYCDALCLTVGDCCYDACQLCGRCYL